MINDSLLITENLIQYKEQAQSGFQTGIETALSYVGIYAYIPIIALLSYAIVKKIPKKYDKILIKDTKYIKELTLLDFLESTLLALSLAAAGGMALIYYTQGSIIELRFK